MKIAILFQFLRRLLAGVRIVMRIFWAGNIVIRHFLGGINNVITTVFVEQTLASPGSDNDIMRLLRDVAPIV